MDGAVGFDKKDERVYNCVREFKQAHYKKGGG
jgi:hypothetical protein